MRLLVVLCLLGNGFGTAYANAQMSRKHAETHRAVDAPAVAAKEHRCHDGMEAPGDRPQTAAPAHSDDRDVGTVDCCDGPTCQCACAYHASFVSTAMPSLPGVTHASVLFVTLNADHASPTLPHLIRPPIR